VAEAQTRYVPTLWHHATDCTALTAGLAGDFCYEQDVNDFYVCEPSSGNCDTAGEWIKLRDRPETCFEILIENPVTTDEFELELPPWAGTMTDLRCEAQGGTSFTIDLCDGEDLGDDTCGTSIPGSTLACTTSGANDSSLSATGFAASDSVSLVITAVSGVVTIGRVTLNCTRD
jgi:hypothetical protein